MSSPAINPFPFFEMDAVAYGLRCRSIPLGGAPVGCMMCEVAPGQQSRIHNHFEAEAFLFLHGKGVFLSDGRETVVGPGHSVIADPFSNHVVRNDDVAVPLYFMSVYWDGKRAEAAETRVSDTLIFSTPPTPNGDLHLGHLSGPYLAADIFRRYLEQQGARALHMSGRDDHQTYVVRKALATNCSPTKVATNYASQIRRTLESSNIPLDFFIEPSAKGPYAQFVSSIFLELYDRGLIVVKDEPALFDGQSGRYLHEAFVSGTCPHCGHGSDGNACEQCGRPNHCVDLNGASSLFGNAAPEIRPLRRLYFRLGAFEKQLADYIGSTPMSAHALALSSLMVKEGLPDICVSHPTDLGIDVPIDAFADQKMYVWFEMAAGYLWAAAHAQDSNRQNLLEAAAKIYNDGSQKIVHFYGFDNTYYHTLLFPAVYFALGINPPAAHIVNELLDLDNKKFSTSRGHLIWGRDLLARVPVDYARWAMAAMRPEGTRSNFSIETFCQEINSHYADTLQAWADAVRDLIVERFDGIVPEAGAWTAEHQAFYAEVGALHQAAGKLYEIQRFSPRGAVAALTGLALKAIRFHRGQSALADASQLKDYLRTAAALSALALRAYAVRARPLTPEFSASLLNFIGLEAQVANDKLDFVPPGSRLVPAAVPRFPRLQPDALHDLPLLGAATSR